MIQTAEPLSQPALSTKRIMHYAFSHHNFLGKGNFSVVYSGINEQTSIQPSIQIFLLPSKFRTCPPLRIPRYWNSTVQNWMSYPN